MRLKPDFFTYLHTCTDVTSAPSLLLISYIINRSLQLFARTENETHNDHRVSQHFLMHRLWADWAGEELAATRTLRLAATVAVSKLHRRHCGT